jgi:microcystin-dependent protein
MADPFVAEVRIFAFNFAPRGWAFCNGQILPISQNTALFSLLGTFYGGNGQSTFALPNLQGNAAMHTGNDVGPGLSQHSLGEEGGSETVTLLQSEIPQHTHILMAQTNPGQVKLPGPTTSLARSAGGFAYLASPANLGTMAPQTIAPQGGDQPHNNMMQYLTLNFCIALQGVFPPRP